ncbi:hypothetical protein WN943_023534 [Citrus x changshan-huyou]
MIYFKQRVNVFVPEDMASSQPPKVLIALLQPSSVILLSMLSSSSHFFLNFPLAPLRLQQGVTLPRRLKLFIIAPSSGDQVFPQELDESSEMWSYTVSD